VRFTAKGILRSLILGLSILLVVSCGGGGGGSSKGESGFPNPENEYIVTVRADRNHLPQNIAGEPATVNGPYTTVIYVSAYREHSHDPIPDGDDGVFACNVTAGLGVGSLYYLDGEHDPSDDVSEGETGGYRSITLGSNSGSASFHFHAWDKTGTATVTCVTNDPQSGKQAVNATTIQVGGETTPQASTVFPYAESNIMYSQDYGGITQTPVQVMVYNEANQAVPDPAPGEYNLVAWIDTVASDISAVQGAQLRSGSFSGQSIASKTINGLAQFTIVSGFNPGRLVIRFQTDRSDNNVMNGIADSVFNVAGFYVYNYDPTGEPLEIVTEELPAAYLNTPYVYMLEAQGGVIQGGYTWRDVNNTLGQFGLTLNADGTITGVPAMSGANISVLVSVSDGVHTVSRVLTLEILADGGVNVLTLDTAKLPNATVDVQYAAMLAASGGRPPYTWEGIDVPAGFTVQPNGVITGQSSTVGIYPVTVSVKDANGATVTGTVLLEVVAAGSTPTPNPGASWVFSPAQTTVTLGTQQLIQVTVAGATPPFTNWEISGITTALPGTSTAGIVINPATGEVTIPNTLTADTYTITIKVTDNNGDRGWKSIEVTVS